jgi:hypothetical protein
MTGHVCHPGHAELHGVTVVVEGSAGRTGVGRDHERTERGVLLHAVAVHDPATAAVPSPVWIASLMQFGVKAEHRQVVVPDSDAARITRLIEWAG